MNRPVVATRTVAAVRTRRPQRTNNLLNDVVMGCIVTGVALLAILPVLDFMGIV